MPAATRLHSTVTTGPTDAGGLGSLLPPPDPAAGPAPVVGPRPPGDPPDPAGPDSGSREATLDGAPQETAFDDVMPAIRPDGAGAPEEDGRRREAPRTDTDPEAARRISGIARSVAQGALEVLGGSRPLQQMARWLDPENYERLQLRANLVRCINDAPGGRGTTLPRAHRHIIVRSARVCSVGPGIYEASVVAYDQKRVRAVALRIERRRGAWRVTALEIG
ncbi:Rv3235 family protein [Arthrobacter sp. B0490]|uniref:Rv3235 family protein n=1 Tax=Arthrobacter sp. B0490 TaxID=2058891 RepID=UPI0021577813|nr:Rv3235 family protein [Arthrobacter sp. B0490]